MAWAHQSQPQANERAASTVCRSSASTIARVPGQFGIADEPQVSQMPRVTLCVAEAGNPARDPTGG